MTKKIHLCRGIIISGVFPGSIMTAIVVTVPCCYLALFCDPFMEDPPKRGYRLGEKCCDNVEGVKKWLEKRETVCQTIREGLLDSKADD